MYHNILRENFGGETEREYSILGYMVNDRKKEGSSEKIKREWS